MITGCCGRSEDTTSWCLIFGTVIFSIIYNFSRFFEFRVDWVTQELYYNNSTEQFLPFAPSNDSGDVWIVNKTFAAVEQTDLRKDIRYIQYYILVTNFIFMGIIPSIIMIIFNVLVVRAVNEANQRRARMTRRQQRNITVTSMLVTIHWHYNWLDQKRPFWICSKCFFRISQKYAKNERVNGWFYSKMRSFVWPFSSISVVISSVRESIRILSSKAGYSKVGLEYSPKK